MSESISGAQPNFVDRLQDLLSCVDYRLALTKESREAIFRLRYECYLREGAIDRNDSLRYTDQYDEAPNAHLLGLFVDGVLSSSIRIHLVTRECGILPDKSAFPDLIDPMIEQGLKMIDVSRFVVGQDASRAHPGLAYLTIRGAWMFGELHDIDCALTATRREHIPFYRRVFSFEVKSEVRDYPTLKKPVALLSLDQRRQRERMHRRYPVFMSTDSERRAIFEVPASVPGSGEARNDSCSRLPSAVAILPIAARLIGFPPYIASTLGRREPLPHAVKA